MNLLLLATYLNTENQGCEAKTSAPSAQLASQPFDLKTKFLKLKVTTIVDTQVIFNSCPIEWIAYDNSYFLIHCFNLSSDFRIVLKEITKINYNAESQLFTKHTQLLISWLLMQFSGLTRQ